jgi:hypothetical protein
MKINLVTPHVCYLRISTFVGSCVWCATHWYGKLICGKKKIDVLCTLTQEAADRFNQADPSTNPYRAGETTGRFPSKIALITAAMIQWQQTGARFLIQGDPATWEPQWVLAGPEDVRTRINAIFAECEQLGWWGKNADKVGRLSNKWEQIWKKEVQR